MTLLLFALAAVSCCIRGTPAAPNAAARLLRSPPPRALISLFPDNTPLVFRGEHSASILVPDAGPPSLPDYLRSNSSDMTLLGSAKAARDLGDGVWECEMEPISWFGTTLVPVFDEQIVRSEGRLQVQVLDSRIVVPDAGVGRQVGHRAQVGLMRQLMERASLAANNQLMWSPAAGGGWSLRSQITVTLTLRTQRLPVPLPMPRKLFERIGNQIISQRARSDVEQNLHNVRAGCATWRRVTGPDTDAGSSY
jgi:hypothetical protein